MHIERLDLQSSQHQHRPTDEDIIIGLEMSWRVQLRFQSFIY